MSRRLAVVLAATLVYVFFFLAPDHLVDPSPSLPPPNQPVPTLEEIPTIDKVWEDGTVQFSDGTWICPDYALCNS